MERHFSFHKTFAWSCPIKTIIFQLQVPIQGQYQSSSYPLSFGQHYVDFEVQRTKNSWIKLVGSGRAE